MEGIHTLKNLLKPGDWLAKVDLKDAYFSIPIHPDHRKYLRFPLGERVYQFTCLPFGLASAPWVFTKTLRPIAALARELGLRVVFYIDDILLMVESKEKLRDQAAGLVYLLQCLGFTINTEKTTQSMGFLGFTVNTTSMELSLPPEKLKIRAEARKLLGVEPIPAQSLARLVGKMNATTEVIPPAPLFFRHLQMDLSAALQAAEQDYETEVRLSPGSREELTWWDTHMVRWNGRSMLIKDQDFTIDSDASILGWGASCQGLSTGGPWSEREKTRHINCLELLAATLALKTFAKNKTGLNVLLRIDNTTAVAYINNQGGTVSEDLVHLTCNLWMWCLERNIHIHAEHVPGCLNVVANRESRYMRDRSDWNLDSNVFMSINRCFGPLELDLFASRLTHQCQCYFSWQPDPFAEALPTRLVGSEGIRQPTLEPDY